MKKYGFVILASLFFTSYIFAQGWSGETEVGTDGKGHPFFSQYLFYDVKSTNVLSRFFWIRGIVNRGEFAVGPTIRINSATLKLQLGGTTDQDIMLAGTLLIKIKGHALVDTADAKFATRRGYHNTLYQKLLVALNKNGSLQFRAEHLQVGRRQEFLRVGAEYQHSLPHQTHIFLAPFYDPVNKGFGGQVGFRFFKI